MNKTRRKALGVLQDRLIALKLDDVFNELQSIEAELQDLRDEEETAAENCVVESKKADMEQNANNLTAALEYVEQLRCDLEAENPVSLIDEARGVE